ncbi:Ran-binding protein 1-like a [Vitis vinifera]|uniref:Ran-binding protein 1-like a n=1 Tax=Vitis vinifera TaxID=29760 RepID=A0A438FJZ8_VITVI|nr:Ran-binding protein 1-like a [Vitis vinifera]
MQCTVVHLLEWQAVDKELRKLKKEVTPIINLEEFAVTTDEEDEDTILDLKVKLYRFNKEENQWKEEKEIERVGSNDGLYDVWEHSEGSRYTDADWSPIFEDLYSPDLGDDHLAWKRPVSLEACRGLRTTRGSIDMFNLGLTSWIKVRGRLIRVSDQLDQTYMDSQVVTVDQFDAATTSIQEAITSLGQRMDGQQAQQVPVQESVQYDPTIPPLLPPSQQLHMTLRYHHLPYLVRQFHSLHHLLYRVRLSGQSVDQVQDARDREIHRDWMPPHSFETIQYYDEGPRRQELTTHSIMFDIGRHSFQAYGSYIPALDLKVCFCYTGMPLNQALRKLIEAGLLTALAPRPLPQPILPQLRMDLHFPYPTDGIHFIDLVELDDHIHMLSWDEPVVEPIVVNGIYKVGGVTFSPWMPTSFRLVLDVTSVQSTTVEPLTFPCYNVQTPVVRQQPPTTARPLEGVASHEEVRREDDDILRQLQSTQTRISIRSLLASSITHRDALIRALSQIKIETTTLNVCPLATAIALGYVPLDFGPSTQTVLRIPTSFNLLLGRPWIRKAEEARLQRLIHPLQLSNGASSTSASTLAASSSPDRMSLMTLYFPDEVDEHGTFAEIGDMVDGVVPHNGYINEMLVAKEIQTAPALEFSEDDIVVDDLFEGIVSPRVSPATKDTKVVDFGIVDQLRECRTCQALIHLSSNIACHFCPMLDRLMVEYLEWLANVVPVSKKDEKFEECMSYLSESSDHPLHDMMHQDVEKCTFGVTSRKLLGYMVSERGIEADLDKIRVILDMPTPMTEREIRDFLSILQNLSERALLQITYPHYGFRFRVIDDDFLDKDVAAMTSLLDDQLMDVTIVLRSRLYRSSDERDMSRVPDSWEPYSRTPFRVTCTDFPMAIFSMGYRHYGKILPKFSSGHEFILVTIDYFTKCVEAASYTRLTSSRVASFIKSHIICRHGVPHELISDKEYISRSHTLLLVVWYGAVLPVEIEMGSLRVALEQ